MHRYLLFKQRSSLEPKPGNLRESADSIFPLSGLNHLRLFGSTVQKVIMSKCPVRMLFSDPDCSWCRPSAKDAFSFLNLLACYLKLLLLIWAQMWNVKRICETRNVHTSSPESKQKEFCPSSSFIQDLWLNDWNRSNLTRSQYLMKFHLMTLRLVSLLASKLYKHV